MPKKSTAKQPPQPMHNPEAHAAFFNAVQTGPFLCRLVGEKLSDGSVVWNVAFIPETVHCRDQNAAIALIEAVNLAAKQSQ